ncbi:RDD family protein [Cellulomonas dongxiuzhuiae]|uniref:RDD family protein n=1 Tax=Cellulomonas dongxiuzhuiae TaxID=2819979 RepID=A0ABX8GJL6_9CELL|nr:RDD family protein [Cellulomonas dongxiuzhuiae]MBO3094396.1 RDD family protein [Cellulomonas dongxiuzhuiae]QWC15424.1 RDD family protein [Cellulomonas dongxiuzhuiae]
MTTTPLAPLATTDVAVPELASWGRRVVAALLDGAVLGAVAWFVAGGAIAAPSLQPTFAPVDPEGAAPWTSSWVVVAAWLAMLVLQGLTGQTPGRRVLGIQVIRAPVDRPAGGPPGVLRSIGRWLAHLVDAFLLIGYLRPLWDPQRRTFADGIAGTLVVRRAPTPRGDRRGQAVTAVACVVVVVGLLAGVEVGSSGGLERGTPTACALAPQDADAPVRVHSAVLVRETTWTRGARAWPWAADARRDVRTRLSLDVSWDGAARVGPDATLDVRTTFGGASVDNGVAVDAGEVQLEVEGAGGGPVEVEFLLDGRPLTSCTVTPGDDV